MKRKLNIQTLLQWAYVEELPKSSQSGGGAFSPFASGGFWDRFAELGTMIDAQVNDYGVVPDFNSEIEPHPDALIIARCVNARRIVTMPAVLLCQDWPDDVRALVDWEIGLINVSAVVIASAILRRGPTWEVGEVPRRSMVMKNGQPAWFLHSVHVDRLTKKQTPLVRDGYNPKTGRPFAGAVRKYQLDKTAKMILHDRAEYYFWVVALEELRLELSGQLTDFVPAPSGLTLPIDIDLPRRILPAAQS